MERQMTVDDLIIALQKVKDGRQVVVACIMGVEVGETIITGVHPEIPDDNDDADHIGICWLHLPVESSVHSDQKIREHKMLTHIARDCRTNETFNLFTANPLEELLEILDRRTPESEDETFQALVHQNHQIGWVIDGRWLEVYSVVQMRVPVGENADEKMDTKNRPTGNSSR